MVTLPPLRERRDDIGLLVATLLQRIAGDRAGGLTLEADVGRALLSYDWPHNVRELEQCVATCVALAEAGTVRLAHLPESVRCALLPRPTASCPPAHGHLDERDEALRLDLLARLAEHAGNVTEVARAMGKARMQIQRWCHRFGIDPNVYRSRKSVRPGP